MHTVTLDSRETATILAALRHWRDSNSFIPNWPGDQATARYGHIATDGGALISLSDGEIDRLCERVNFGCEADASF